MANKLILIGIDQYLYLKPLNNCVKDAQDLKDILLEKYDFEDWNVTELYDHNATSKSIQDLLMRSANTLSVTDNLIVFYSGHGHYDDDHGRGYWAPSDSSRKQK